MGNDTLERAAGLHLAGIEAAQDGRYVPARRLLRQALETGGGLHSAGERGQIQRTLTEINRRLGLAAEAVAAGQAAVRLLGRDAAALTNLGLALSDASCDEAALACFDEAISVDAAMAAAHLGRAEILLRQGDFGGGWIEYAWRRRLPGISSLLPDDVVAGASRWNGAAGAGTVLVVADQGFGDMIQFARFMPWAARQCRRLVLHAPSDIWPIFAGLPGIAALISDWAEAPAFSAWCALSDLPRLANTGPADLATEVPYVSATDEARASWRSMLDAVLPPRIGRKRVGLVWAGQAVQANDYARSARLGRLAALADIEDVDWVSLQKGSAVSEIADWPGPIADLGGALRDFGDTAAVVSLLDLVVSVDTSVAHLAGAMGRPVWLLLRQRADWRWGDTGARCAWYPTALLFRQANAGDWEGVAGAVKDGWARCTSPRRAKHAFA